MDKLKKLTEEYLKLSDKCDGTSETFAALHPLAEDLADRVKDLQLSARSREVRYLASKLYRDVSDMELRVPFPVSWTVKMKKKQKETQDILSYHTQAAGCSDKARAKASGGRQPIEECGRTGL